MRLYNHPSTQNFTKSRAPLTPSGGVKEPGCYEVIEEAEFSRGSSKYVTEVGRVQSHSSPFSLEDSLGRSGRTCQGTLYEVDSPIHRIFYVLKYFLHVAEE